MAIDEISISLSGMSGTVANDAVQTLTAASVTKLASSPTNATRVEFDLLRAGLDSAAGQDALKEVIASTNDSSASPTGNYSVTFDAALFATPGLYQVRAKGIVTDGAPSPKIVTMLTALSDEIRVTEAGPQTLDDVKVVLADHEERLDVLETPAPPPGP